MRKVLLALLVTLGVIGTNFAQGADIPDEQVVPGSIQTNGDRSNQYGVYFEESVDTLRMPTLLYGYNTKNNQQNAISFCTGLDDPACAAASGFKFYALFPPCENDAQVDCLESVYAITPTSPARIQGKYLRTMPSTVSKPYKGDTARGLPNGGNAGIWTIPGVKNQGGSEDYAVILSRVGDISKASATSSLGDLRAVILPVTIVSNPGYRANVAVINDYGNTGVNHVGVNHPGTVNFEPCAIVEDGACALRQGFPEGVQFGMAVRFSKPISGWLHGRISSPQIDYQTKSYGTRIEMQGLSTKVPVVGGYVPLSAFTDEVKKTIKYIPNPGSTTFPGASGENSMNELSGWAKLFGDKAIAYPSQWIFYNLPEYQMQSANQCIKNSTTLAGFVTTNSTTYAAGPPTFNQESQSLDYKVASAHYLKDGSVFQGEYNLYIDSKVARCIYQFSSAPISATISIVNETGEAKVATTTVRESGGWIHLSAAGFTFSNPTLKVKLTQEAAPAQVEKAAPAATSITCVKGKISKKVTGFKPTCPVGYKKK
jgi:hypothetical protein